MASFVFVYEKSTQNTCKASKLAFSNPHILKLSANFLNPYYQASQLLKMETPTTLIAKADDSSLSQSRLGELKEKQKSLRESLSINRSSSQLSSLSLTSKNSDEDSEKLSRSLRKIRVRRPSLAFRVEMDGMVEQMEIEETKKNSDEKSASECTTTSQSSTRTSDPLSLRNMLGKASGKTVMANQPIREDEAVTNPLSLKNMLGKAKGKTVLAAHPASDDQDTAATQSGSDDDQSDMSASPKSVPGGIRISLF